MGKQAMLLQYINSPIGLYSYSFAALAFLILTGLLISDWKRKLVGTCLIVSTTLTVIWASVSALYSGNVDIRYPWLITLEILRTLSWIGFLLAIIASSTGKKRIQFISMNTKFILALIFLVISLSVLAERHYPTALLLYLICTSVFGIYLIEQIVKSQVGKPKNIIHISLALATLFTFDFIMFSHALLFNQINWQIWQARGFVNGIVAPLIAISVVKNPDWSLSPHVSREFMLHSVTTLGVGLYLVIAAAAGYYIKYFGGSWGSVIQIILLTCSFILLVTVLFSTRFRAHARVYLSKHFYNNKYDYRQEWMKFTYTLTDKNRPAPERVISGISNLIDCPGGALWLRRHKNRFELETQTNDLFKPEPKQSELTSLLSFLERSKWVVDLDDFRKDKSLYEGLILSDKIINQSECWLIVPLLLKDNIMGFVILYRSSIVKSINWEDRDLLKLASAQSATLLAEYLADLELVEARQFEAFNKLSAYIVHDLKNILGQQSLILGNATRHRDNPKFIDDVFDTVENSVARMTKMMEQLRSSQQNEQDTLIDINQLIQIAIDQRSASAPTPTVTLSPKPANVMANFPKLSSVFSHLIQNAQEATDNSGSVEVTVSQDSKHVAVTISDTGQGMTLEFIKNRLFKPFETTKGLTGMGIGAFESREYIRLLNGDILVDSSPNKGSVFKVLVPSHSPLVTE